VKYRASQLSRGTDTTLDAAIMTALREAGGDVLPWAELRDRLPRAPYWAKVAALVRLHHTGQVDAIKLNGRTFVGLPIAVAA
jgi:hypothetical protein